MPPNTSHSNEHPTISVIIPVFNREDTIEACLESIFSQTLSPHEIILVDDGSTDRSAEVAEKWVRSQRSPIRYQCIHQENHGKSAALNTGVAVATCEWIAFNDSDDLWLPHKLAAQFELLSRQPETRICVSDSRFANDTSRTETNFQIRGFDKLLGRSRHLPGTYRILAQNPNGIFMQSLVAHRSCIEKVFPLDPTLRVAQDIDMIFRLSLKSDFSFHLDPLVEIDRTPTRNIGLTKQHDMKSLYRLKTKENIIKGWLEIDCPKIDEVRSALYRNLSRTQASLGAALQRQGQRVEARHYLRAAWKNHRSLPNLIRCALTCVHRPQK